MRLSGFVILEFVRHFSSRINSRIYTKISVEMIKGQSRAYCKCTDSVLILVYCTDKGELLFMACFIDLKLRKRKERK